MSFVRSLFWHDCKHHFPYEGREGEGRDRKIPGSLLASWSVTMGELPRQQETVSQTTDRRYLKINTWTCPLDSRHLPYFICIYIHTYTSNLLKLGHKFLPRTGYLKHHCNSDYLNFYMLFKFSPTQWTSFSLCWLFPLFFNYVSPNRQLLALILKQM